MAVRGTLLLLTLLAPQVWCATVTTFSPAHASTISDASQNIVLTFNEAVIAGTGSIVLTPSGGSSGASAISIYVTDTSQITFDNANNQVTINPDSDLTNHGGKT